MNAKCHGSEDERGNAMCEGPAPVEVSAIAPNGERFVTVWCAECRAMAEADGYRILSVSEA